MSETDLIESSKTIFNRAYNPATPPSTEELPYINEQNIANRRRSKIEAYSILQDLLETDVSEEFLKKFQHFFMPITAPKYPTLFASPDYETDTKNE